MPEPKTIFEFGDRLIASRDLDAVNVVLWEVQLESDLLKKYLLAYWCFYNIGTAAWICSQKDYWKALETAAASKDYPRGYERRHFRAENARKSVKFLRETGIEKLFKNLLYPKQQTLEAIISTVCSWNGFGPWVAFEIADLIERMGLVAVDFNNGYGHVYRSPAKGADIMWEQIGSGRKPDSTLVWAIQSLKTHFSTTLVPPRYERVFGFSEAETVLCRWKGYLGGRYKIGDDAIHCKEGLLKFARCPLSQRILKAGKSTGLW